ncbi:TasA family protein [Virgibacillus halodenitrificans]|uniref:TasA family protein n=1 Tax=Virgibacillus halodenitrificans TaxID=1482 RepID=UPI002DB62AD4|nr:TasA family protein [Virgibacillus halodenitrificans]MEC2160553.1 TasA family protein [Virgibacillus halodenitrificans]
MNLKNSILSAVATATIGLCLVGSGTYAYFNDTEEMNNTFAAGLLDLGIDDKEHVLHLEQDLVPGDTVKGNFKLSNYGTVDIKKVEFSSSYEVNGQGVKNNEDDIGDHLELVLEGDGKEFKKTLTEFKNEPVVIIDTFPVGMNAKNFSVSLRFKDGENQNQFQGDKVTLKWKFEAIQRDGKTIE